MSRIEIIVDGIFTAVPVLIIAEFVGLGSALALGFMLSVIFISDKVENVGEVGEK